MSQRLRRVLVALAMVVAALGLTLATAPPASAHATLVATDPAEGAVLAEAPEQIRFTFDETVVGVPDGVQVFDAAGEPIGAQSRTSGDQLDVELTDEVGDGTLVVVWRVLSADGHPIVGSLSFSVGAPSASVERPDTAAAVATDVPTALTLSRWIGYLGLFLAAGLVGFALLFLPADHVANRARGRLVRVARVGAVVAAVAWVLGLPLTALYQLGGGAGTLGDGATWTALQTTEYVVVAAVVAGSLAAVALLGDGRPARPRREAALAAAVVAACAPALTGHTRGVSPEALAIGADMLHLLAGCVWFGGLAALVLVLPDLAGRGVLAAEVLARFSVVAAGVLVALAATGTLLAWRIVGSWSALLETGYGRLLLVKIVAALVAVGIAAWNRFALVPRLQEAEHRRTRRAGAGVLARTTAAEAVVLVVVLMVTGLLVDRSPEAEASVAAVAETGPASATGALGDLEVEATLDPAATGPTTLTLELRDAAGQPTEGFAAPTAQLLSDDVDLGAVALRSTAPGVYEADAVIPAPGTWQVQVSLRTTEFDNPVVTLDLLVP